METLGREERSRIVESVAATVRRKHFDPGFDDDRWTGMVSESMEAIVTAPSRDAFESALTQLIRRVGTPESGLIHERDRQRTPKGIGARFQYCQPSECAPGLSTPTPGGDVLISRVAEDVGWLKVTKFPGAVGIDIARQIDRAVRELAACKRLIVDLRGNAGGGLAFLRVMSYLTPERVGVGYSVTRARAERGYSKETLAVFDRIPSHKFSLLWLALKFGWRDDSVSIFSEALGQQKFHGRMAILVDGHTTGAGERIAAFAQERGLASVVGGPTAGRLICCSSYKVGRGYWVRIPARAWYTWHGALLENKGVVPDHVVAGGSDPTIDSAMSRAIDLVRAA